MTAQALAKTDDRRASPRHQVNRPAVLRIDETIAEVAVEDLTRDGCRIRTTADLPRFARVSIGLAGVGHTPARLVWRDGERYGCAFDRSLPPSTVAAMAQPNVVSLGRTGAEPAVAGDRSAYAYHARFAMIAGVSTVLWTAILGLTTIFA